MKPGKLYIKIFLSFVLVLIVTEILVFGLFYFSSRRSFRSRFQHYVSSQALIVKELLEEKIKSEPQTRLAENESVKDFILRLGEIYGAKIWLADPNEKALFKSFPGNIPDNIAAISKKQAEDFGNLKMHRHFKKGWMSYIAIPVEIGKGEIGSLHVFFEKMQPAHPEGGFGLGLVGIGFVIALLIIPVSRIITNRIKKLRHSALRIAEGDLSHRVTIKGNDEIGELGRSFNRMANRLERMIRGGRELTANISHELRSPLARIRIAEQLLRERWERGDHKACDRHLDSIREDIEELDRLIGSILVLSKLDIQETPRKRERINPADLINELLERLKPAMSRKGLHLVTDLSLNQALLGDRDALRTALSNILENTVKFTPEKGNVSVKIQSEEDSLRISVTNSFDLVSKEDLTKIFEPFYRTERSHAHGSGLGLAITKKIIEQHGGSIEAGNSAEGLSIHITFPHAYPRESNG